MEFDNRKRFLDTIQVDGLICARVKSCDTFAGGTEVMHTPSFNRLARLFVVLVPIAFACSGNTPSRGGVGGNTSTPANGGSTTVSSGGGSGTIASGGRSGTGGTSMTTGGSGAGGAAPGTGGKGEGGTTAATGGTGGTAAGRTGGTAAGGTGGTAVGGAGGTAGGRTGGTAGAGTGGTAAGGAGGTAGAGAGGATGVTGNGVAIYVSPSGDDTNDGSVDHPLKTLTAARDLADKRKANNTPVTVFLRAGTYYLSAPVEFGPSNSGTSTAPIVYMAYGSEKPVISGAIKVTPSWSTSSGSIQVATIATNLKVDQLFLNGKRQVLARYPNYDATKILDGHASDCISSTRVGKWADPTEGPGYIRAMHPSQWGGVDFIITGKSGTTVTYKWVGDNNRFNSSSDQPHASYRMVENIFEELDAAGEWYYKKSTGQLYFWPPSGTDLSTATIELASQDELFRVVGTSATATVQYLTFQGLTFTGTYRTLFSKPYELLLQGDWGIARAGTVFMNNAENIRVDSCLFDQIGGNGVFMSGHNRSNAVVNSDFEDAGASCVAIVGLQSAVRCAAKSYGNAPSCNDKLPGPQTDDYPASILVENNTMVNFGRFEKQVAGVQMSMTSKNTVRHNTIHTMPRAGINFNDGCWGGHLIEWNWVYGAVLETSDHGPLNAWGRDRNLIFQSDPTMTKLDAVDTTTIQNNRFEIASPMFGIDLDDQSSNYLQQNNLLIGGGLKVQWSRYNTYENNILVNGAVIDIHSPWDNSNHVVKNNIIVGDVVYSFYSINNLTTDIKNKIPTLDYNLFYNGGKDPRLCTWLNRSSNPFTWTQWKAAGLDANSVVADPMFTSPTTGDYTVKDGSPALTLGFKNFPMTGFGVTSGPQGPTAAMPESPKN